MRGFRTWKNSRKLERSWRIQRARCKMNNKNEQGSTREWEKRHTEKIIKMTRKKVFSWTLKSKGNKLNKLKTWLERWFSEYLKNLTCSKIASDSYSFLFPVIPLYFTFLLLSFQVPTPYWPIARNCHYRHISNSNIVHSVNKHECCHEVGQAKDETSRPVHNRWVI